MAFNPIDLIFPKRCVSCGDFGSYICAKCRQKIAYVENPVCPVCQRQAVGGRTHPGCATRYSLDGLIVGFGYRGPVKFAIRKIKYKWASDVAELLVGLFCKNLWKFDIPGDYLLVPIPLHSRRKNWRGFNQADLICKTLAKNFNVEVRKLLVRTVETKTQVGLTKEERRTNIRNAFEVRGKIPKEAIILVDDVYTTGATMNEACKVFKKAGAREVWGMALALG